MASKESSTSADFNPYRVWLGIPQNKLPANHYSLLGLEEFEQDLDVISSAADRVMAYVKTFQGGKYSQQSQNILNEIAAARVCLLNDKSKQKYDQELHSTLDQKEESEQSETSDIRSVISPPAFSKENPPSNPTLQFVINSGSESRSQIKRSGIHKQSSIHKKSGVHKSSSNRSDENTDESSDEKPTPIPLWLWGIAGSVAAALLVVIVLLLSSGSSKNSTVADNSDNNTAPSTDNDAANKKAAEILKQEQEKASKADSSKAKQPVSEGTQPSGSATSTNAPTPGNSIPAVPTNTDSGTKADVPANTDTNVQTDTNTGSDFTLPPVVGDSPDLTGFPPSPAVPGAGTSSATVPTAVPSTTVKVDSSKAEPLPASEPQVPAEIKHVITGKDFPASAVAADKHVLTIDDVPFTFRWIPSGSFMMGSPEEEPGHLANEKLHSESVDSGFWMLETEITREMFAVVTGSPKPAESERQLPLGQINWTQARDYCDKLSRLTGLYLDLPTEVQWEYACRAGTTSAYNYGSSAAELHKHDNYCDVSFPGEREGKDMNNNDGFPRMSPVRSFPPNAWGLYGMLGNVDEWCRPGCKIPINDSNSQTNICRGGHYYSPASACRCAFRTTRDYTGYYSGFRIIRRSATAPQLVSSIQRVILTDKTPADGDISMPGKKPGQRAVKKFDDIEYKFRWCPPGEAYFMRTGSPDVVVTNGFWMLETEVTQQMYNSIMEKNPSFFKGDNNPVEQVSWNDAQEFCRTLSDRWKDVQVYLPTEVQWVYAGQTGTINPYTTGKQLTVDAANCNKEFPCSDCPKGTYFAATLPVGTYQPNKWGLYDIHGNVSEWCYDKYEPSYRYRRISGLYYDPVGSSKGDTRITRGSSWFDSYVSTSFRYSCQPVSPTESSNKIGFRICTLPTGVSYPGQKQTEPVQTTVFANLPTSIDLPDSPSPDFTDLITFQTESVTDCQIALLGGNQCGEPHFTYSLDPAATDSNEQHWSFYITPRNKDKIEIAQLKITGNKLQFRFTEDNASDSAQMIRNTILKIKIANNIHYLALRTPILIKENAFDCFENGLKISTKLKYVPQSIGRVEYQLYPVEYSPATCIVPSVSAPIQKATFIDFVYKEGKSKPIRIKAEILSAGQVCKFSLDSTKDILLGFKNYYASKAAIEQQYDQNKSKVITLNAQIKAGTIPANKLPLATRDLAQMTFFQWGAKFMKSASEKPPLIHFEIFMDCDGRRLTLVGIEPPPDPEKPQ